MVQKRPFDAEEMLEVSFKHPKHAGPSDFLPLTESVFPDDDCDTQLAKTSGGSLVLNLVQLEIKLCNIHFKEFRVCDRLYTYIEFV